MDVKFEMNKKAMRKLEKGLEGGWQVPLDGTEAAAVASVKKQMKAAGLEPNDAGVRKLVREARKSVQ